MSPTGEPRALRLAIVTESYAPLNTSAAVQLATLAEALGEQGHDPVVIVPSSKPGPPVVHDRVDGTPVIRLRMGLHKGEGYVRRLLYEAFMPFAMRHRWSAIADDHPLDGVIWYSPSIFHGIFAGYLKRRHRIPGYLVLRDIFPDWAVDIGVMTRRHPAYWFFKLVERHQYRTADVIGVQTPGNLPRLADWAEPGRRAVEILHNWYAPPPPVPCSIDLGETALAGRAVFVYAGNIGVAQNVELFIDLAEALSARNDIGFVFVGRGSGFADIARDIRDRKLDNVLAFDEIPSAEVPALYAQCRFGIVSLHPGHSTHNIPGKFVAYVSHGLPVLAAVNEGNDLIGVVEDYDVGIATDSTDIAFLKAAALSLLEAPGRVEERRAGCRRLADEMFRPTAAAAQIVAALARSPASGS